MVHHLEQSAHKRLPLGADLVYRNRAVVNSLLQISARERLVVFDVLRCGYDLRGVLVES